MAGLAPHRSPAALAAVLEALEVRVETAIVERRSVPLADYPGGPRPSSVVRLSGRGCSGQGENVAFYEAEHERFVMYAQQWLAAHAGAARLSVGTALGAGGSPYERAALQAALVDLGLRQAGLSLCDLTGVREASLRFVRSLAADPKPDVVIQRLRSEGDRSELKVDVDPSWTARAFDAVARDASIAIFDFKGRADAALAHRLHAASARTLLEDPPADFSEPAHPGRRSRVSRDASLLDENAVISAISRGEAVNLKAPRMGGPLIVLRALQHALGAHAHDTQAPNTTGEAARAYLGGMFEVGVGRAQARQIAALYCASAPNDLALNGAAATPELAQSPALIHFDQPGFGL